MRCLQGTPSFLKNLRKHNTENRHKIIMGDLNFNQLSKNEGKFLRNLAAELALEIINDGPMNFPLSLVLGLTQL